MDDRSLEQRRTYAQCLLTARAQVTQYTGVYSSFDDSGREVFRPHSFKRTLAVPLATTGASAVAAGLLLDASPTDPGRQTTALIGVGGALVAAATYPYRRSVWRKLSVPAWACCF